MYFFSSTHLFTMWKNAWGKNIKKFLQSIKIFPKSVIFVCAFRAQFDAPSAFVNISQLGKEHLKFTI